MGKDLVPVQIGPRADPSEERGGGLGGGRPANRPVRSLKKARTIDVLSDMLDLSDKDDHDEEGGHDSDGEGDCGRGAQHPQWYWEQEGELGRPGEYPNLVDQKVASR